MSNCEYEYYTVHTDSLTDSATTGNTFTNYLFNPIKDIIEVKVILADFDASVSGSNVCYLNVDELSSRFNDIAGNSSLSANPSTKSQIQNPIVKFIVNNSGRTNYKERDYNSIIQYFNPIRKLDRLTTKLRDENGNLIILKSNDVHITYLFKCKRGNFCE